MQVLRGVVTAYDAATHTATVSLEGATGVLRGLPVLRSVPPGGLAPGDRVVVALWPDVGAVVLGAY
ncbi:MAG: hypothetical protein GX657_17205 [Chloroflexi bacterium]|jgi:hypothetical protein|nr:hypothetical protein [Chloroflexota bacterium]